MQDWLDATVCVHFPRTDFLFLQAPSKWRSVESGFVPAWLTYTQEHHGAQEDLVDSEEFAASLLACKDVVLAVAAHRPLSCVGCVGLTQAPPHPYFGVRLGRR